MANASFSELSSASRIVGALAHEINNPLQGILSLLTLESKDNQVNDALHARLKQINEGIFRIARTVESFSVIYENFPRVPEKISAADLNNLLETQFTSAGHQVTIDPPANLSRKISCFTPEQFKLVADAFNAPAKNDQIIKIKFSPDKTHISIAFEKSSDDSTHSEEWHKLEMTPELSGLPILIQEITRLGGGETEFKFDPAGLRGIKLILPLER